ncbi:MAG: alpha/beta fold hydrolase [Spirochaetaceae bacterium]|nr:alpha/beta fold hydrolase [Myxococcales bacterium]MCB9723910.1 alpha/beta fold hydrolase [Spirochaetaceae bacterium]HPG24885.1 alpha/beta fold hydrolase [Myxococcota bacterium]
MTTRTWTFEDTSRFAQLGDLRLHYNDAGEGDVVVLLHGGGPGATGWSNFKQNVPAFASRFRVLLVDQPQFGLSDKPEPKEQFNVVAARAIRDLLDELDVPRAHFVGNSLGGGTSLRFALDYPDRASRLVLMGPGNSCVPVLSPQPSEGLKILASWLAPPGPTREKLEAFVRIMVYDQTLITEELIEERFEVATEPSVLKGMVHFLTTVMGPTAEERRKGEVWRDIERIEHPTLLIWGRDDRVLPLDGALFALQRMQDARLHVFPKCGHWAQLEHAREFERLSIDFLSAS